jgi:hypothetical protein
MNFRIDEHVTATEGHTIRERIDKEIIKSVILSANYETNLEQGICCWTCIHYNNAGCHHSLRFEPKEYCFSWVTWSYKHWQAKTTLDNELFEI